MPTDSPLLSALDEAYGIISSLQGPSRSGLLDRVFGQGALAAYESSTLGTSVDPFGSVGLTLVDSSTLRGHPGAFASHYLDGKPEILLNRDWLKTATTDEITGVLLEEFGHAIDWVVNHEADTPGDEGAAFAGSLLGNDVSDGAWNMLAAQNDRRAIQVNGRTINVEFATTNNFTLSSWAKNISGGDGDVFPTFATPSTIASILVQGSNASTFLPQTADFTTTSAINAPGFAKYDWSFVNSDGPGDDEFGYLIGSSFNRLDNAASSGNQSGYITPFFSTPSGFGYRVSTATDTGGSLSATVSNFSFTPIADAYYTHFNQVFAATRTTGTTFNVGSLLSNDVWILPDDPATDSDYTTNFNSNGSINRAWIISDAINDGQPLAIYLTNGREMLGGASSAEDLWAFNTNSDGTSGDYYILTSGSYTTTASSTVQINSSIALTDLDQLRSQQTAPAPTLLSISSTDYNFKIGDTATVTFTFNTPVSGFTTADVTAPSGSLLAIPVSTDGGITWTASFVPSPSTEDSSNAWSVDLTGVTNSGGLAGSGSFSSSNYSVDTIRPTIAITSDKTVINHGQTAVITFTLSEASNNFDQRDVVVQRGRLSQWKRVSPSVYAAIFMPTDSNNSNCTISVASNKFTDIAGNDNTDGSDVDNNLGIMISPTAIIRSTKPSVQPGSVNKITISLTEPSNNFSLSSIRSSVALRGFRKVSALAYEVEYTAPLSGQVTLSVIPGSYTDKLGGNVSIANSEKLDSVTIDVTAIDAYGSSTSTGGSRGVTSAITVGRSTAPPVVRVSTPVAPKSNAPQPIGRATSSGLF